MNAIKGTMKLATMKGVCRVVGSIASNSSAPAMPVQQNTALPIATAAQLLRKNPLTDAASPFASAPGMKRIAAEPNPSSPIAPSRSVHEKAIT